MGKDSNEQFGKNSFDNVGHEHKENNGFCETMQENSEKGNDAIVDSFGVSKDEILNQLAAAVSAEESVKVFAKRADRYGIEAMIGLIPDAPLIPSLGDWGPAIISTLIMLYLGHKAGLEFIDMLKVCFYQAVDLGLGSIPLLGMIADFFYKSNVKASKVFEMHTEKIAQLAKEKGASQEEINEIYRRKGELLHHLDEHLGKKSQRQKKANEWKEKGKHKLSEWKEKGKHKISEWKEKRKNRKKE